VPRAPSARRCPPATRLDELVPWAYRFMTTAARRTRSRALVYAQSPAQVLGQGPDVLA
jgi:hypothetical protein